MLLNQHTSRNCALCTAKTVQEVFSRQDKKIYCE